MALVAGDLVRVVDNRLKRSPNAFHFKTVGELMAWNDDGDPVDVMGNVAVFLRQTEYDDLDDDWIIELASSSGVCYTLMSNVEKLR